MDSHHHYSFKSSLIALMINLTRSGRRIPDWTGSRAQCKGFPEAKSLSGDALPDFYAT